MQVKFRIKVWKLCFTGAYIKENFKWDVTLNWAKNINEVVELYEGVDVLQ